MVIHMITPSSGDNFPGFLLQDQLVVCIHEDNSVLLSFRDLDKI